ncbi:MAG TPA: NAD(P)H-binding protein, partial [Myxococcota bacterium]|nr:NAD(P)H-binding protein [Myxococcota bacterium]
MLVVFGANGRSGVELVRAALARGLEVRGVCRDNRDQGKIAPFLHYQSIYHADPDRPQTLAVAVRGATTVVCCLDRRTTGVDGSEFGYTAAEAVIAAAAAAGVPQRIHMSVIGASRMALGSLERQAGFMDFGAKKAGAALFRVSCYHDEVAAAPLPARGRYAPLSRSEAAAILLDWLPRYRDGAELRVGGPEVYSGAELNRVLQGKKAPAYPGFPGLPAADLSVTPATTLEQSGTLPVDRLG